MPNRVLGEVEINKRLLEIDEQRKSIPKLKAGDPRQAVKWGLVCETRRLRIRLSRLQGRSHTFKQEIDLINSVGGKCSHCGASDRPTIDHKVPISKGGHNGIENLQVLCASCNSKKSNKHAK